MEPAESKSKETGKDWVLPQSTKGMLPGEVERVRAIAQEPPK
jgi:hypothetical protein